MPKISRIIIFSIGTIFLAAMFWFLRGNAQVSGTFSKTEEKACPEYGCENTITFECSGNECNPSSDATLEVTIKGDYNFSPEWLKISLDGKEFAKLGGSSEFSECEKEYTKTYEIKKEELASYFVDQRLEIKFKDSDYTDCCCNAQRKVKLEYTYGGVPPTPVPPPGPGPGPTPPPVGAPEVRALYPQGFIKEKNPTLTVLTDIEAICKFDLQPKPYNEMQNTFDGAGTRSNTKKIGPLEDGGYVFYVRCRDAEKDGVENPKVFKISFFLFTGKKTTCTKIVNNGSPADKYDVIFIGEDYSAQEEEKFSDNVMQSIQIFFSKPPFDENPSKFNIYAVYGSYDFGSKTNGRGFLGTALGRAKTTAIGQCGLNPEHVYILYNSDQKIPGGPGGVHAWGTSITARVWDYHEFGHGFGLPDHGYCTYCIMCYSPKGHQGPFPPERYVYGSTQCRCMTTVKGILARYSP